MDGTNTPYSGGPSPQQQNLVRSIWTQAVKKFGSMIRVLITTHPFVLDSPR